MQYIIDRFEGEYAVCECEDDSFTNISTHKIPPGAKEGDILTEHEGILEVDAEATIQRREHIKRRFERLWE